MRRMFTALAVALALAAPVAGAAAQTAPRGLQQELANIQNQRAAVMDAFRAYAVENPVSTGCAAVMLGTTAAVVMDQLGAAARSRMEDGMGGAVLGSFACVTFCSFGERAVCGEATGVILRVAAILNSLESRERSLRGG